MAKLRQLPFLSSLAKGLRYGLPVKGGGVATAPDHELQAVSSH